MTEVVVDNAAQGCDVGVGAQSTQASAGQLLRQARERQHMSIEALAHALKVPVYKVQALEEHRWDVLTDSVFARALALSTCRLLHVPSEDIMVHMPKHEAAKLSANPEGINTPFKDKSLRSLMSPANDAGVGGASKWTVAVLLLAAIGAGLYFVPQWDASQEATAVVATTATIPGTPAAEEPLFMPHVQVAPELPADVAPQPETMATALPEAASDTVVPAPVMVPAAAVPAAAVPGVLAPAPVTAPVVVAEPAAVAQAASVAPTVPTPNTRVLRFTAKAETWVQVRNAQKQVVMEKILKAGDVYEATLPQQPLQAVVGNAGATTLEVDGAAFDLVASARNNVARFEVK